LREERRAQAGQRIREALDAERANRPADAFRLYGEALALDPNNPAAQQGYDRMAVLTGARQPTAAQRVPQMIEIRKQEVQYRFHDAITRARQAMAANDFSAARAALLDAEIARDADRAVFTADELKQLDSEITNTRGQLQKREGSNIRVNLQNNQEINRIEQQRRILEAAILPGQTTPSRDEELWVIAKTNEELAPALREDNVPAAGALVARLPDNAAPVPVPLKHTDVKADIAGYIAAVDVTQQYHNPFSSKIEALYVFPLPHNAAVNEFVMTIGPRKIRGIIKERAEAERVYQEARSQGYVASLLTQERPNVFTQSVANIEPGKQIDINIRYFHTLAYADGWYEWHFPMVVGPRFNPPGSTDGIAAVARGTYGTSGQKTEVQYLKPNERSGHDISLAVNLDAGVKIEQLEVPSHKAEIRTEANTADIKLSPADTIPNKDFVLRYKVAGDRLKSAIIANRDERGGYFTLMLYPPQSLSNLPRKPLELVYVLDCSGSMEGRPITQAKNAIRTALRKMPPDDTFQIVKFSSDAVLMSERPLPASHQNVQKALAYLDQPYGGGGTMMLEGIKKALDVPPDPSRLRFVCFLTDGFIGNETEILREIKQRLGTARIFSFGVGSSVNRYLLDHMAKMGRGAVAYLSLNQPAEPVMDAFVERISHPALTDITIDWGGMNASDVFPNQIPDLFVGRPVILAGKFGGNGRATLRVKGRIAGEIEEIPLAVNLDDPGAKHAAMRTIWARMKIADLADRATWDVAAADLATQIKTLALEHSLMSAFTAFVAVDSTQQAQGAYGTSIAVPVPVPEGVRYDTTVERK
jgi:Ca-activated chloride channel family protein